MLNGRLHTNKKMLLGYSDIDEEKLGLENYREFFQFVDSLTVEDELSTGQWKKLYAILCTINDKTEMNYRIYENPQGVYFDVTTHTCGGGDIIAEDTSIPLSEHVKESNVDKIKRYVYEVQQIDLKIDHLKKRKQEYVDKIQPLKDDLIVLMSDVASLTGSETFSSF